MSEEIKNQQAAEPEALTETEINEQMQVRINKMHQIEEKGWKPFGHKFEWTHHAQDIADQFEELTANETVVRVLSCVSFCIYSNIPLTSCFSAKIRL